MLREIQYLRAVSILMVLYLHASFLNTALGFSPYFSCMGNVGVEIFFVISGYVVSASFFKTLIVDKDIGFTANVENNIRALKTFFIKRFFRLFPVVLLLIATNITCKLLFPASMNTTITEQIMGLFSHITMQTDMDVIIFTLHDTSRNLNHLWSLAVEERFYLLIPFIYLFCGTVRRFMVLAVLIIVGLSILKALYPFPTITAHANGFLHLDSFMFGILVYLLGAHTNIMRLIFSQRHSSAAMTALSILILVILARLPVAKASETVTISYLGTAYYYLSVYALSSILVALAAQDKGYVLNIPGLRRILFWIGEKSYSIYVFQLFYIAAAVRIAAYLHIAETQVVLISLIFAAITAIGSEVIYRLWEFPLRNLGRRIAANVETGLEPSVTLRG
jgi:peptidoglycan/LPS O-acetylase OafA/YrhL